MLSEVASGTREGDDFTPISFSRHVYRAQPLQEVPRQQQQGIPPDPTPHLPRRQRTVYQGLGLLRRED